MDPLSPCKCARSACLLLRPPEAMGVCACVGTVSVTHVYIPHFSRAQPGVIAGGRGAGNPDFQHSKHCTDLRVA